MLTRCSRNCSSVTCTSRVAASKRTRSASADATFENCFLSAITLQPPSVNRRYANSLSNASQCIPMQHNAASFASLRRVGCKLLVPPAHRLKRYQQTQNFHFNCYRRHPFLKSETAKDVTPAPGRVPWSSYTHYATGLPGTVEIEFEWTSAKRDRGASTHSSHETKA